LDWRPTRNLKCKTRNLPNKAIKSGVCCCCTRVGLAGVPEKGCAQAFPIAISAVCHQGYGAGAQKTACYKCCRSIILCVGLTSTFSQSADTHSLDDDSCMCILLFNGAHVSNQCKFFFRHPPTAKIHAQKCGIATTVQTAWKENEKF
jgi:hypothetical protein